MLLWLEGKELDYGYKGPKGTYQLCLSPRKKSLFEIMCDDLKRANEKYNIVIPWYIMTSTTNNRDTIDFFEENRYFNYPKEYIMFFNQSNLPVVDITGKLILQEPYMIREGSNGNGDVFNSMKKDKIFDDMERQHINWISFGGIDNVLLKNVDPLILGLAISNHQSIASKSILKKTPLESTAVYCRINKKPSILNYWDIDLSISNSKDDDGDFLYRDANMLSHFITLDTAKQISQKQLPYHRTYKKNAFVNQEGVKEVPDKPNVFKFENFIFDAFSFFDDMLLLRVNEEEEFAPIKDFRGIYNPDTAKEKYEKYWNLTTSNNLF